MKYEWLDAFLLALPGVEQDFQLEWGWERYMIRGTPPYARRRA